MGGGRDDIIIHNGCCNDVASNSVDSASRYFSLHFPKALLIPTNLLEFSAWDKSEDSLMGVSEWDCGRYFSATGCMIDGHPGKYRMPRVPSSQKNISTVPTCYAGRKWPTIGLFSLHLTSLLLKLHQIIKLEIFKCWINTTKLRTFSKYIFLFLKLLSRAYTFLWKYILINRFNLIEYVLIKKV